MIKTRVISIHSESQASRAIEEAAKLIRKCGLVVYPTESCYGLGCNALDEAAVRKVFAVKGRPVGTPLPIIVSDIEMWKKCAFIDERAEKLIREFLPGPLTIALKKKPIIPDVLNPGAIAARISSHPIAMLLVKVAGVPITATSANLSGKPPHYTLGQVLKDLNSKIDLVLDAGELPRRKLSTIIDFTLGPVPVITRVSAISVSAISKIIPFYLKAESVNNSKQVEFARNGSF
jgi:L-threonylcarbamoyladenylate synthase